MSTVTAIYMSTTGKHEAKACRASGFLQKGIQVSDPAPKGIADICAERYIGLAGFSFSMDWEYKGEVVVDGRRYYHYYTAKYNKIHGDNIWFSTELT